MEAFDETPGVHLMNVGSYVNACYYLSHVHPSCFVCKCRFPHVFVALLVNCGCRDCVLSFPGDGDGAGDSVNARTAG